jgi:hypothetical protein
MAALGTTTAAAMATIETIAKNKRVWQHFL